MQKIDRFWIDRHFCIFLVCCLLLLPSKFQDSVKVVTITKELTHKRFQHAMVVLFNWPWLNKDPNID